MAITINWDTRVITVPRADMTLVQTLPTEIRNLDLNWFRLQLKDLEDNVDGIVYLDTHTHNTEVSLGGLTYARVIEIINNYTVTFEDGQYAVNLTGANSNVGDVVNVNQVSVRSQNSAGLISSPDIEFASFNGGVLLDVDNGFPGTVFPAGTVRRPVNNLDDALLIADYRGFNKIYLTSDLDLTGTQDLSGFDIVGDSHVRTDINIGTDVDVTGVTITQANVTGVLDGETEINSCLISDLTYFNGHVHNSGLAGTIELAGGANAVFTNCMTYDQTNPPVIDMGGAGQSLAMPDYSGIITVRNLTDDTQSVGIGVDAGMVILEDTVIAGQLVVSGVGLLSDLSTGTAVVNSDGLLNKDLISRAVWDESIANHLIAGSTGRSIGVAQFGGKVTIDAASGNSGTDFPTGTERVPVDNLADALTIATNNGIEVLSFDSAHTLQPGDNVSGYTVTSDVHANITLSPGCLTFYTNFTLVSLEGQLSGYTIIHDCAIGSSGVSNFYGIMDRVVFNGGVDISADNTKNAIFIDCYTGDVSGPPSFDCGGDGAKVSMRGLTGAFLFVNKTGSTQKMFLDLYSARVGFDSTVTAGEITVRGVGYIYLDDSTGTTFDLNGLISQPTMADAVWDEPILAHTTEDTTGHEMLVGAYSKHVHIDAANGESGTDYPYGTPGRPVNNVADALVIAHKYNFDTLHVVGSLTIMNGEDVSGFTILADRSFGNSVTVEAGAVTNPTYFTDLTVSGTMGGGVRYTTCVLGAIEGFDGGAKNCLITDEITVVGNGANYFTDCDVYSVDADAYKRLNISDKLVNLIRCRGNYAIAGKTSTSTTAIDLVAGCIKVESTCVAGTVDVAGIAHVVDESGAGCTVKVEHAVSAEYIASGVWDEALAGYTLAGTAGKELQDALAESTLARKLSTNRAVIVANPDTTYTVTIYDDNDTSILQQFTVTEDKYTRTPI